MHVPLHSTVYSSQERIVCIILYSYSISRLDCKKVGYSVDVVVVGFLFLVWEFTPLCLGLLGSTCVIMNKSINTVMFGKHCKTIVQIHKKLQELKLISQVDNFAADRPTYIFHLVPEAEQVLLPDRCTS